MYLTFEMECIKIILVKNSTGGAVNLRRKETKMKCDVSTKIYRAWGKVVDQPNVNKYVKAVIINFGDERGDIIVENDNFGTRRKYADFTNGKKKAGLNPMQIVFSDIDIARACGDRYVNKNNEVCYF